jgi:hypothetical protein
MEAGEIPNGKEAEMGDIWKCLAHRKMDKEEND